MTAALAALGATSGVVMAMVGASSLAASRRAPKDETTRTAQVIGVAFLVLGPTLAAFNARELARSTSRRRRRGPKRDNPSAVQAKADIARRVEQDKMRRISKTRDDRIAKLSERRRTVLGKITKACDATRRRLRKDVSVRCDDRRGRVRSAVKQSQIDARIEAQEKKQTTRELSGVQRKKMRALARAETRKARREVLEESSSEVEHNIDPALVPVWRKVRGQISAGPRISRTEAFLQFVEENESEVWAAREEDTARELEQLQAEQWKQANPSKGAKAFERFHWGEPSKRERVIELPDFGELYALGKLKTVEYETSKGGESAIWVHDFDKPQPTLTATPEGELGPIVGGRAHVTERGIEG